MTDKASTADTATTATRNSDLTRRKRIVLTSGKDEEERVIRHGYISKKAADEVFLVVLGIWGFEKSNSGVRDEIKLRLAELAIHGTSIAADLEATSIVLDGVVCPMSAIVEAMRNRTQQPNPVKVFFRSFENAIIPITSFNILNTVENYHIRSSVQVRYGITMDEVAFAFDMFEDAAPHLSLTAVQIQISKRVKVTHLIERQVDAARKEVSAPLQDVANRAATSASKASAVSPPPAPLEERVRFTPLR